MPPITLLVALADPTRCRIVEILLQGPQPVHVLSGGFDISRPAISRHLRILKAVGLISEKKVGRENRYSLHPARLKPLRNWLDGLAVQAKPAPVRKALVKREPVPPPAPEATSRGLKASRQPSVSQMGFDF